MVPGVGLARYGHPIGARCKTVNRPARVAAARLARPVGTAVKVAHAHHPTISSVDHSFHLANHRRSELLPLLSSRRGRYWIAENARQFVTIKYEIYLSKFIKPCAMRRCLSQLSGTRRPPQNDFLSQRAFAGFAGFPRDTVF